VFFGAAAWALSKMLEGIGLIYEGIIAGDIIMAVKGFIYVLGGLLGGIIGIGLGIIAAVILGGLALILGGFVEWMFNAKRDNEMLLSGLLQIGSMIGLMVAGLLWFFSMSWIPLLVVSIIAGVISIMTRHASGGIVNSPLQLVGEKGPELVSLPRGSRVHTNSVSNKMMAGNTINVHVNGRVGASDAEIRDIANKVAKEINLRMNRTGASGMGFN